MHKYANQNHGEKNSVNSSKLLQMQRIIKFREYAKF